MKWIIHLIQWRKKDKIFLIEGVTRKTHCDKHMAGWFIQFLKILHQMTNQVRLSWLQSGNEQTDREKTKQVLIQRCKIRSCNSKANEGSSNWERNADTHLAIVGNVLIYIIRIDVTQCLRLTDLRRERACMCVWERWRIWMVFHVVV